MVLFLNSEFLFFAFSFIHTFLFSFLFLLHFVHHTHIPIISTFSPFFFSSLLPLDSRSSHSFLSPALSFSTFFFLFSFSTWFHKFSSSLCDTSHIILLAFWCHYLQTHIDTHGEKGEIAFAPPHRHRCSFSSLRSACNQGSYLFLFFFLVLD